MKDLRARGPGYDIEEFESLNRLKPNGFWYSIDGAWERMNIDVLANKYAYAVNVDGLKLKRLTSRDEVEQFTRKYGDPNGIDWSAVAKDFDGIELNPYEEELQRDYGWYGFFHCASGVIWNPNSMQMNLIYRPPPA